MQFALVGGVRGQLKDSYLLDKVLLGRPEKGHPFHYLSGHPNSQFVKEFCVYILQFTLGQQVFVYFTKDFQPVLRPVDASSLATAAARRHRLPKFK